MTQAQMIKRRELIQRASKNIRIGMAMDSDESGRWFDEANMCVYLAKRIGCPRLSDEELGVIRFAENDGSGV